MPRRNFIDYLTITAKGLAMGAADAVPGVSGGTIAFISGIYEELIFTISNVNLSLLKTLKEKGLSSFWKQLNGNFIIALLSGILIKFPFSCFQKEDNPFSFWKQLNGNFIIALLSGILISFVSFMKLAKYLIENHPIFIWSFFFGLIIASILYIGKQIKTWNFKIILALILGGLVAYYITSIPPLANNDNPYFLFIAGAIAICAMILPGISGSFILLILGAYKILSDAIHDYNFRNLFIFIGGATVGLLSFSKVLKWLFKHYENTTLAVLTGFIIGSLNVIWPWKQTITVFSKEIGKEIPFNTITDLGSLSIFQIKIQMD